MIMLHKKIQITHCYQAYADKMDIRSSMVAFLCRPRLMIGEIVNELGLLIGM